MAAERDARIAAFLSNYVRASKTSSGEIPVYPTVIKAAIQVMIEDLNMTKDEIRLRCLIETNAFIPDDYFPEV